VYFLDSDTFRLYRDKNANVLRRISQTPLRDIWISGITVEENLGGQLVEIESIRKGKSHESLDVPFERLIDLILLLSRFNLLAYGQEAEDKYRELKQVCKNVKPMDMRLAAHAIVANKIIVTRNATDFDRIPGVTHVDWSK
jgi:tRNA(fMet)-specific endonuclease VapC